MKGNHRLIKCCDDNFRSSIGNCWNISKCTDKSSACNHGCICLTLFRIHVYSSAVIVSTGVLSCKPCQWSKTVEGSIAAFQLFVTRKSSVVYLIWITMWNTGHTCCHGEHSVQSRLFIGWYGAARQRYDLTRLSSGCWTSRHNKFCCHSVVRYVFIWLRLILSALLMCDSSVFDTVFRSMTSPDHGILMNIIIIIIRPSEWGNKSSPQGSFFDMLGHMALLSRHHRIIAYCV